MRINYEVLVAIVISGCATSNEVRMPDQLAHRPQAYRDAYVDGCKSVQSKDTQAKDMERIRTDPLYANGWYDGVEECRANKRPPLRDAAKK